MIVEVVRIALPRELAEEAFHHMESDSFENDSVEIIAHWLQAGFRLGDDLKHPEVLHVLEPEDEISWDQQRLVNAFCKLSKLSLNEVPSIVFEEDGRLWRVEDLDGEVQLASGNRVTEFLNPSAVVTDDIPAERSSKTVRLEVALTIEGHPDDLENENLDDLLTNMDYAFSNTDMNSKVRITQTEIRDFNM